MKALAGLKVQTSGYLVSSPMHYQLHILACLESIENLNERKKKKNAECKTSTYPPKIFFFQKPLSFCFNPFPKTSRKDILKALAGLKVQTSGSLVSSPMHYQLHILAWLESIENLNERKKKMLNDKLPPILQRCFQKPLLSFWFKINSNVVNPLLLNADL